MKKTYLFLFLIIFFIALCSFNTYSYIKPSMCPTSVKKELKKHGFTQIYYTKPFRYANLPGLFFEYCFAHLATNKEDVNDIYYIIFYQHNFKTRIIYTSWEANSFTEAVPLKTFLPIAYIKHPLDFLFDSSEHATYWKLPGGYQAKAVSASTINERNMIRPELGITYFRLWDTNYNINQYIVAEICDREQTKICKGSPVFDY